MTRGIVGWIGLAATLAIAVPIAFMGVDFLLSGNALGWAFLAVAALAVVVEEYATRPGDVVGSAAGKVVGAVAKTPEEE
jgi:hypothetical protein